MHRVQAIEVQVAPIHHVEGPGLHGQDVRYVHVVQLAVADVGERRNRAAQAAACRPMQHVRREYVNACFQRVGMTVFASG